MTRSAPSDTLALLDRLVGFPTISRDPNRELVEFLRQFLAERGIASEIILAEGGRKANLFATIGSGERPGILLSGHTDVVPVEGQHWSRDPFRMTVADGRAYGRGTTDMKGFLACALALVDRAARTTLSTPIHLALSHDEEMGCVGVRSLLDDLVARAVRPRLVIVGEPTSLHVATGHKGKIAARATCRGTEAHSALAPRAVNAIHLACDVVAAIRDRQKAIARGGPRDDAYDIPYTTLHVGRVEGGTALNIVPNRCTVEFEIRAVAPDDAGSILGDLVEEAAGIAARAGALVGATAVSIEVELLNAYPGLATSPDSDAVRFVQSLVDADGCTKVAFGTEGGLFAERLGVPTVVCGPGSMDQGHKPDEFIALDQLAACDRMLDRLLQRCI